MNAGPYASAKMNRELEFYARLGKEWLQSKPILKCKECGSLVDFFVNCTVNEWGHYVYVWCEECGRGRHITEFTPIVRMGKPKKKR